VVHSLADRGKRVLLVGTDLTSNLDEMLRVALPERPKPVPGAAVLSAININPDKAAEAYRVRVIDQMGAEAIEEKRARVREGAVRQIRPSLRSANPTRVSGRKKPAPLGESGGTGLLEVGLPPEKWSSLRYGF